MDDCLSDLNMGGDNSFFSKEHPNPTLYCVANETHVQTHSSNVFSKTGNQLNLGSREGAKRDRSSWETPARDHIMSERKRRQLMAERFIALSAIIPGLKKIDKASVLSEAINYVKQLKGRIAVLEQESSKKSMMIFINKCRQSHPHSQTISNHVLPQLQVQAIGLDLQREILIRILCEKPKAVLLKLLTLLENMHLSIVCTNVLPLGKNTLNITIIAQMGEAYNMAGDEFMRKLTQDVFKLYEVLEGWEEEVVGSNPPLTKILTLNN